MREKKMVEPGPWYRIQTFWEITIEGGALSSGAEDSGASCGGVSHWWPETWEHPMGFHITHRHVVSNSIHANSQTDVVFCKLSDSITSLKTTECLEERLVGDCVPLEEIERLAQHHRC